MPRRVTEWFARTCKVCGAEFQVSGRDIRRGRGHVCSGYCSVRNALRALHQQRSFKGELNPAFKGWASRNPVVYVNRFKARNPEKVAAQKAVRKAVLKGVLVRPSACDDCGKSGKPDAHHDDYTKPLAVIWVCRRCHVQRDRARQLRERAA